MTRTRDEIELDLPFFVNGSLTEAERAEFSALLDEDAQLAAERDAMAAIRSRMQAEDVRSPGEFGLARLMRDVDQQSTTPQAERNRSWVWQAVAAIAVIGFLGQALFLPTDTGTTYELAGAADDAPLIVGFYPEATEAEIRGVLLDAGVEITGGPSALGLYRLSPLDGVDLADASAGLEAATTIVESVENALD